MLLKGVSFFVRAQPDSECRCMDYTKRKGLLHGLECLFWSDVFVSSCSVWRGLAGVYGWRKLIREGANERQRQTDGQRCG